MWGTSFRQRLRLAPLRIALGASAARFAASSRAPRDECGGGEAKGISVVIPERDAPQMLAEALAALSVAQAALDEPLQVIVVVNGAELASYDEVRAAHPLVEWIHETAPLGFSRAIARGLAVARHPWTLLLNNDMTLEAAALRELARHRAAGVFSISAQILQWSAASARREETGFVDWYVDDAGVHAFHAPIPPGVDGAGGDAGASTVAHLAGSGGASLFRTAPLARYVRDSVCYDPFYWEDIEWGVRAWRDGYRVLFCPGARAQHRHRATTSRFYDAATLERIVARNGVLFDLRNGATTFGVDWLMRRVCDLPYDAQRELARPRIALGVAQMRRATSTARATLAAPPRIANAGRDAAELATGSFSFALRPIEATSSRPRLLVVTPFAVFPPRHGGARRIAGLLATLRRDFDVILVTDEAALYDSRSFAGLDGLCAVHLVQRPREAEAIEASTLEGRMHSHDHPALADAVCDALHRYRPHFVQIEFAEIASLVRLRAPEQRWILGLHDAYGDADFASPRAAARFRAECLDRYDAVTVCSAEDLQLVSHRNVVCVPNASSLAPARYAASESSRLLFLGPFRYAPNLDGVRAFLRDAFPAIRAAVPGVTLRVLGGDGAPARVAGDPLFAANDVEVVEHREDVAGELAACALTINPLTGIRGSPIKLVESIAAGRVCVSTADGARGFADDAPASLVIVDGIAAMAPAIVRLLQDAPARHAAEAAGAARAADYAWPRSAALQAALYGRLRGDGHG